MQILLEMTASAVETIEETNSLTGVNKMIKSSWTHGSPNTQDVCGLGKVLTAWLKVKSIMSQSIQDLETVLKTYINTSRSWL